MIHLAFSSKLFSSFPVVRVTQFNKCSHAKVVGCFKAIQELKLRLLAHLRRVFMIICVLWANMNTVIDSLAENRLFGEKQTRLYASRAMKALHALVFSKAFVFVYLFFAWITDVHKL